MITAEQVNAGVASLGDVISNNLGVLIIAAPLLLGLFFGKKIFAMIARGISGRG